MSIKTYVNCLIRDWDAVNRGKPTMPRDDIYREAVFWSTKLILSALGDDGVLVPGDAGSPPLGFLHSSDRTTIEQVEDREIWELYGTFYSYLTTDVPMDQERTHAFCQFMREYADVILRLRCPVGLQMNEKTAELIGEIFLNDNKWGVTPTIQTLWKADYVVPQLEPNQIVCWRRNGPPLRELINAYDQLFNRLVGLPVELVNPVDFLVRYGHGFRYPRYTVPTAEQMRHGIGLRITDLHLFPDHDLVAKSLASELDAPGTYTMVIPSMGLACEYEVSRVSDRSYRVDLCAASVSKPYPRWVEQAFPDKKDKLV